MVRSATPQAGGEKSLGDLVALAAKDVSQLVRYEINLAKSELRGDVQRVLVATVLGSIAVLTGSLVVILLCFAFAYGLVALHIWTWAAFLIVAGVCALLAVCAVLFAWLKLRRFSALGKTRKTVTEDLGMLRRGDGQTGERAQLPGRTS